MALVWRDCYRNSEYQVRRAGRSLRLYTNGVFHSQWNPARPLAGHVWDLLLLPALFLAREPARALVLGVGGGAVVNALHHFFSATDVVGVDLDAMHLRLAKRYFLETPGRFQGEHCCARSYLERHTERFAYVVEDLFCDHRHAAGVDARKAIPLDLDWLQTLSAAVAEEGVLVVNCEQLAQVRAQLKKPLLQRLGFAQLWVMQQPHYDNAVAVLTRRPHSRRAFDLALEKLCTAFPKAHTRDLNFSLHRLW